MHKRILSNITNKHKTIKDNNIKNTIDNNNNIKNTIDNNNNIDIVDNNIDNLHISITNNTAHLSLEEKKFIDIRNLNDSLSLTMYNQHIKDVIEYNLLLEDRKYSIIKVDHKLSDNNDNNKNNNDNNNVNGNRDINKDINNNTNTKNNINNKEYIDCNYIYMQPEITWAMRNSLIDYLIDIHWSLNLTPETLYLTVNIIDRFLSKKIVSVSKLQPLGITALFIASKYEEVSTITIDSILNICYKEYNDKDNGLGGKMNNNDTTNNDISYNDIIKYEKYILHLLNYNINIPPALSFLRLCSKANNYVIKTRTIAKYLLELTLVSNIFLKYKLSIRATAAFSLACKILQEKENKNNTENNAESNKDTENNNNNKNNNDNKGIENNGNIPLSNITNNNKDKENDNNNKGNSKTIENNKNNNKHTNNNNNNISINNLLYYYIGYKDIDYKECIKDLLRILMKDIEYEYINKKYSTSKFLKVSTFIKKYIHRYKDIINNYINDKNNKSNNK